MTARDSSGALIISSPGSRGGALDTLENDILTSAAGQVLSMVYLKSIREDASAAYSVSAGGKLRRLGNKPVALIQAYCPMDPAKSAVALKLLAEGMKENTMKMDADKVQKVKDFMLKDAELSAKTNGYWMGILDDYIWSGVDFHTNYKKTVEAITPAKLAAHLKQKMEKQMRTNWFVN